MKHGYKHQTICYSAWNLIWKGVRRERIVKRDAPESRKNIYMDIEKTFDLPDG